jgi:hypothetical protein
MSRYRLIVDALWPTLLMWLLLVVIAVWQDASLPTNRDDWAQFLVLCLVIEFLAVKSFLMARRMRERNWLTVSLIAANVTFVVVYLSVATRTLWPPWYGRHVQAIRWATYVSLSLVLIWGIWELANTPAPAPLDERVEEVEDYK